METWTEASDVRWSNLAHSLAMETPLTLDEARALCDRLERDPSIIEPADLLPNLIPLIRYFDWCIADYDKIGGILRNLIGLAADKARRDTREELTIPKEQS